MLASPGGRFVSLARGMHRTARSARLPSALSHSGAGVTCLLFGRSSSSSLSLPPSPALLAVSSMATASAPPKSTQLTLQLTHDIQTKWMNRWAQANRSADPNTPSSQSPKPKHYVLAMFPYPSGNLHMGHVRVYTLSDSLARFHRLNGKQVLHPMGWDAFGLPAENAAIERGIAPSVWTERNIAYMRRQLQSLGMSFDWDKEVATCFPNYYTWTQWIFLQLHEAGLAYRKEALVNWDPVDETVLANEQVDDNGRSWRSGAMVEKRLLNQWFFKITDYAEKLLDGLSSIQWPEHVKQMQRNWIGKSTGAFFNFAFKDGGSHPALQIYTTRPETVFGVTYVALAFDHPVAQRRLKELGLTITETTDGLDLQLKLVHPFSGQDIPVFAASYVLSDYGTGAVMGVPAHDERDASFAKNLGLPSKSVLVKSGEAEGMCPAAPDHLLVDSAQFSGQPIPDAIKSIMHAATSGSFGGFSTQYKLRDWLVSRQRYWGAPIPMIHCEKCGVVPVPEKDLPVLLPAEAKFTGRGGSPLKTVPSWLHTKCPCCNGPAQRDTDTMDTFVDSSWYFLRFTDPHSEKKAFDHSKVNQWMPVDVYVGGVEHAILHLLYARFLTKVLADRGFLDASKQEPFQQLLTQGMVEGRTHKSAVNGKYLRPDEVEESADGSTVEIATGKATVVLFEKMSKSKYNGVDPQEMIQQFGADIIRIYMLFKAPPEIALQWDTKAIQGVQRWLSRVNELVNLACNPTSTVDSPSASQMEAIGTVAIAVNNAVKMVTQCYTSTFSFNNAVSELMKLSNTLRDTWSQIPNHPALRLGVEKLVIMLSPMAPFNTSEWYERLQLSARAEGETPGNATDVSGKVHDVSQARWPAVDESVQQNETCQLVIQVKGKVRLNLKMHRSLATDTEAVKRFALEADPVKAAMTKFGVTGAQVIVAPSGMLLNIVK